jgi:hypothetical protein
MTELVDLQLVTSVDEARRVHRTDGLYLVSRAGTAHAEPMTCPHMETAVFDETNRFWRIATDSECRALRMAWCSSCS